MRLVLSHISARFRFFEDHQFTIKVNNPLLQRHCTTPLLPNHPPSAQCSQSVTLKNQKIHSKTQTSSLSLQPRPQQTQPPFPSTSRQPPQSQHNLPPPPPSPLKSPRAPSTQRSNIRKGAEQSMMREWAMNTRICGSFRVTRPCVKLDDRGLWWRHLPM